MQYICQYGTICSWRLCHDTERTAKGERVDAEADEGRRDTIKYRYIFDALQKYGVIDEEHGLLTAEKIRQICTPLFEKYGVKYAYLFGSYAKGKATERSDVDLLISMPLNGLRFYELVEVSWKTTACSSKKFYGTG